MKYGECCQGLEILSSNRAQLLDSKHRMLVPDWSVSMLVNLAYFVPFELPAAYSEIE